MTRKIISGLFFLLALMSHFSNTEAKPASTEEVQELRKLIEQQEKTLQKLKARVEELEGKPSASMATLSEAEPKTPPPPIKAKSKEAPSPAEDVEAKMVSQDIGRESPVPYRDNFDDRQDAAPRPDGYTFDPQYRGFIPIPKTAFMVKFNPKPRVDLMFDNRNPGDDFRFVPARIPIKGSPNYGGGEQFNANGNGSQIRVDVRAPSVKGNFRFYYQNDFFGSDEKNFQYRLQHLYGQYYNVTAGYTYGVFEDPDAWPDTLDYEGPNAVIYARRPLLHYTLAISDTMNMTFGLEDPDFYVDNSGDPGAIARKKMPDIGFNFRWEPAEKGHLQFSSIFRSVGANGDLFPDDNDFGWGLNLAGAFNVSPNDSLQFMGVIGYGVGGMGNDTSFVNSDVAFDSDGNAVALPYGSILLGYTHQWNKRFRSTFSYGFANLGNTDLQPDDAYNFTHYASGNLIYQLLKRWSIGIEGLYGYKEVKDGNHGDVFRIQLSTLYSIFD